MNPIFSPQWPIMPKTLQHVLSGHESPHKRSSGVLAHFWWVAAVHLWVLVVLEIGCRISEGVGL
jgi:hypothetical protein